MPGMATTVRHIKATFDPDAGVWWAHSDDVPGLVSEAATLDALIDRMSQVAGELLSMRGGLADMVTLQISTERRVARA